MTSDFPVHTRKERLIAGERTYRVVRTDVGRSCKRTRRLCMRIPYRLYLARLESSFVDFFTTKKRALWTQPLLNPSANPPRLSLAPWDIQVILPLYPQFSISTSGSSLRVLNEEFTRRPEQWGQKNVVHTVVPSYHDRAGYVNAMANLVAKELAQFTPQQRREGVQVRRRSWIPPPGQAGAFDSSRHSWVVPFYLIFYLILQAWP